MRRSSIFLLALALGIAGSAATAQDSTTRCYSSTCVTTRTDGQGNIDVQTTGPDGTAYSLTTRSARSANGDLSVRTQDSMGNSYSLDTTTRGLPGGGHEVTSRDSAGNSYSIRNWCDAAGCHSRDTMGNTCTVTKSGQMIGCGM